MSGTGESPLRRSAFSPVGGQRSARHYGYIGRLQPLGTLGHLELHLGALFEAPVTVGLNGREVHEHVLPILPLDEAVAFGCVKPFHCAFFFHVLPSLLYWQFEISDSAKKNRGTRF